MLAVGDDHASAWRGLGSALTVVAEWGCHHLVVIGVPGPLFKPPFGFIEVLSRAGLSLTGGSCLSDRLVVVAKHARMIAASVPGDVAAEHLSYPCWLDPSLDARLRAGERALVAAKHELRGADRLAVRRSLRAGGGRLILYE